MAEFVILEVERKVKPLQICGRDNDNKYLCVEYIYDGLVLTNKIL